MKTLTEIRTEAIANGACEGNLYPFRYLNEPLSPEKELLAWQVVLGNRKWLIYHYILCEKDIPEVEKKANYIAVEYYFSSKIAEYGFKDGKLEGLFIMFYDNGSISSLRTYKKSFKHGIEKRYFRTPSGSRNISIRCYWEDNLVTKTQYYYNVIAEYITDNCRLLLKAFKGIF